MSARTQPELSERFTAGSGKVAHLFRRLDARTLKILSVKRRRAGRLDVGARASSLTLDLHAVGLTAVHSHGYGACAGVSPAFWRGRPRAPARAPAQSPLARRSNLITPPPPSGGSCARPSHATDRLDRPRLHLAWPWLGVGAAVSVERTRNPRPCEASIWSAQLRPYTQHTRCCDAEVRTYTHTHDAECIEHTLSHRHALSTQ